MIYRTIMCICCSFIVDLTLLCQELPQGFEINVFVDGLDLPTSMEFAPDGRLFITEKSGSVRIIEDGILLDQPFIEVATETQGERGLNGLTFDPNYEFNKLIYLYYSLPDSNLNQISKVVDAGNTAVPSSEELIFKFDPMWGEWHNGGAMLFGDDGKLYVALGDGTDWVQAQNLNSSLGKIFRINPDGSIPEDNPFYNQLEGKYKGIWAYGVRNPFSMAKSINTGRIFFNDVGNNDFEEVNELLPGNNFGWNLIEGPIQNGTQPPESYADPIHYYNHEDGCAIVGACFYEPNSSTFPPEYFGKYFFMDFCNGWLKTLDPITYETATFATGLSKPVDICFDGNGNLYILDINQGKIFRIQFSGTSTPNIYSQPQSFIAAVGENVIFELNALSEDEITYQWYENGESISSQSNSLEINNVSLSMDNTEYFCVVSNSFGSDTSDVVFLTVVDGTRPEVHIQTSLDNSNYVAGDTLYFSATVTDPDEPSIPASNYYWNIDFHHNVHTHPAMQNISGITNGYYVIPNFGEVSTDVWYRVNLKVIDSDGLSQTAFSDVFPELCSFNVATVPSQIFISADGNSALSPFDIISVKGMRRTLQCPDYVIQNNHLYQFNHWDENVLENEFQFNAIDTSIVAEYLELHEYIQGESNRNISVDYYRGVGSGKELYQSSESEVINENWTVFSPFRWNEDFPTDSFSVHYSGSILAPYTGLYNLQILHDGLAKFTLEDSVLINESFNTLVIENSENDILLNAGEYYNFKLEYEHFKDFSRLALKWNFSIIENEIIPSSQLFPENYKLVPSIPEGSNFLLFPNPTNGAFDVIGNFNLNPVSIQIYNLTGQIVYSQNKSSTGNSSLPIEVFHLRPGIYIMRIETNGESQSIRFVKGDI